MRTILLLVLMYGAPLPAPEPYYECHPDCFERAISTKPIDCAVIHLNVTSLLSAYQEVGPVSPLMICEILKPVVLIIRPEKTQWRDSQYPTDVSGLFQVEEKRMFVARDMWALAHESLHAYEVHTKKFNKLSHHYKWDENETYQMLMSTYTRSSWNMDDISLCR